MVCLELRPSQCVTHIINIISKDSIVRDVFPQFFRYYIDSFIKNVHGEKLVGLLVNMCMLNLASFCCTVQ